MQAADATILIVDDDPTLQRLLAKWLENAGHRVRAVGNARVAMEEIESTCPGILITDWDMPDMDGLELCRWLRSRELPRYVYTFLLTVRTGTNDIIRGLDAGADDFLKKPVDRHELLARLRSGARVLELEMRLSENARRDTLTGLLTQRAFFEKLHQEWQRSRRYGSPLSCVMLDIDFFKRINDSQGHAIGDRAIQAVASWLQRNMRHSDVASRYGGEEFCVMLPETNEQQALLWADRTRAGLAMSSSSTGVTGGFTVSFGVAQPMDDTSSPEQLVDMADQALLVAKRAGRNRVVGFRAVCEVVTSDAAKTPSQILQGVAAREIMTPIVAALRHDETIQRAVDYFLHFRLSSAPVVDDDGNLIGMLSEKDLIENMVTDQAQNKIVRDIMSSNVIWYDESAPVLLIYEFLGRVSLRSVVIVSNNKPIGVISRGVMLRWCCNSLAAQREGRVSIDETQSGRAPMLRTAEALLQEATKIQQSLNADRDIAIPSVIGGASRLEELVVELLASVHSLRDDEVETRSGLGDFLLDVNAIG